MEVGKDKNGKDTEISETAFAGCSSFIVKAKGGSLAEEYARENYTH